MNSSILILRSQEQGKIIEPLVDELLEPLREAFYAKHEDADQGGDSDNLIVTKDIEITITVRTPNGKDKP